jgi:hypothetical protein
MIDAAPLLKPANHTLILGYVLKKHLEMASQQEANWATVSYTGWRSSIVTEIGYRQTGKLTVVMTVMGILFILSF